MIEKSRKTKECTAIILLCSIVSGFFCACAQGTVAPAGTEEVSAVTGVSTEKETEAETEASETENLADPVSVLFIGNSHTFFNEMPAIFRLIAKAAGRKITVKSVTKGGWTLEKHANKSDECGAEIDRLLQNERFDFVVLQENSDLLMSSDYYPGRYKAAVRSLASRIRENGGVPVLFSTWGNRLSENKMDTEKTTTLAKRNTLIGEELDARVAYAGFAFMEVYSDPANTINLHYTDNHHPSLFGSYLAAMTIYAAIFPDADVRTISYRGRFTEDEAAALKNAAYETMKDPSAFLN